MNTTVRYSYIKLSLLLVVFALFLALVLSFSAVAASAGTDYLSNEEAKKQYFYFNSPLDIFADSNNLYVLDESQGENSLHVFSQSGEFVRTMALGAAEKVFVFGTTVYALEAGNLYSYVFTLDNGFTKTSPLGANTGFEDLYITENNIFLLRDNKVEIYNKSTSEKEKTVLKDADMFTLHNSAVYAASGSQILYYDLDTNKTAVTLDSYDGALLSLSPSGGGIALLSGGAITSYSKGISQLKDPLSVSVQSATDFCYSNGSFYLLNGYKSVVKYSSDLKNSEEIVMSQSSKAGFYKNPSSVSTRLGMMLVADKGNNRIVADNGKGIYTVSLPAPVSTCVDDEGAIYAANSENKISKLSLSGTLKIEASEWETDFYITSLKCDSSNNLLALSGENDLYLKRKTETQFTKIGSAVLALDCPIDADFTYLLMSQQDEKVVKKLSISESSVLLSPELSQIDEQTAKATDLASDGKDAFYILDSLSGISRYNAVANSTIYQFTKRVAVAGALSLRSINVSNIDFDDGNGSAVPDYRDILALDAKTNSIKVVPFTDFDVTFSDPTEVIKPDTVTAALSSAADANGSILRTVINTKGCNVFAQKSEAKILGVLPYGYKVIVPLYDASAQYTKIIADNTGAAADPPFIGYIKTSYLSADPLSYTKEPSGRTFYSTFSTTKVYPVPCKQTVAFESAAQSFSLKTFVANSSQYGYVDNFPENADAKKANLWYRVSYEKSGDVYEGFVIASFVSEFEPNPENLERPQVNAKIISANKDDPSEGANIYSYDEASDKYVLVNRECTYLEVGTGVEVSGVFNPGKEYTLIIYLADGVTWEGYVKTANLKYQGVTLAQIIAVILIVITLIVIAILIVNKVRAKRRNIV